MRLVGINGFTKEMVSEDTTINYRERSFNREYRATYRDSLISSEKLVEGQWHGKVVSPNDTIYISLSEGSANSMGVEVGDKPTFNVQGAMISTVVGSLREVDWNRVQTNFRVVFPEGVLEEAPQFHVLITKVETNAMSARYQQAIVRQFPNVSIIDLSLILNTLDDVLGKISFVIQFMAMFSIVTGLLVSINHFATKMFDEVKVNIQE